MGRDVGWISPSAPPAGYEATYGLLYGPFSACLPESPPPPESPSSTSPGRRRTRRGGNGRSPLVRPAVRGRREREITMLIYNNIAPAAARDASNSFQRISFSRLGSISTRCIESERCTFSLKGYKTSSVPIPKVTFAGRRWQRKTRIPSSLLYFHFSPSLCLAAFWKNKNNVCLCNKLGN